MTKILTKTQVRTIVTNNINFDESNYDLNIIYAQEIDLMPVMGEAFYNDFLTEVGGFSAPYQTLNDDYIQYIVAFSTAYFSIKKDLYSKMDNQGVMTNRTAHSDSAVERKMKAHLLELRERIFHYQVKLVKYLLNNAATYPLFDDLEAELVPNFRDFLPQ